MLKYVIVAWLALVLLTYTGFCFGHFQWHSDRYLIEAALKHEIEGGWSNTPAIEDVARYLEEYPQCCSVSGSDPLLGNTLINAIFLWHLYAVTVKYPVAEPAENLGAPFYESILIMDRCGKSVFDRYSMEFSTPIPAGRVPALKRIPCPPENAGRPAKACYEEKP